MSVTVCQRHPPAGQLLGSPCPDCGHLAALHVGVERCPVCELLELLDDFRYHGPQYRRLQRITGGTAALAHVVDAYHHTTLTTGETTWCSCPIGHDHEQ